MIKILVALTLPVLCKADIVLQLDQSFHGAAEHVSQLDLTAYRNDPFMLTFHVGETMCYFGTHQEVTDACGDDCCVGENACFDWSGPNTVCQGACIGTHACAWFSHKTFIAPRSCISTAGRGYACASLGENAYREGQLLFVGEDSCVASGEEVPDGKPDPCFFLGHDTHRVEIGPNSCNGDKACQFFGIWAFGTLTINENTCNGLESCRELGGASSGRIEIGPSSCQGAHACERLLEGGHTPEQALDPFVQIRFERSIQETVVGENSCNNEAACQNVAQYLSGTQGLTHFILNHDTCNSAGSCENCARQDDPLGVGDTLTITGPGCATSPAIPGPVPSVSPSSSPIPSQAPTASHPPSLPSGQHPIQTPAINTLTFRPQTNHQFGSGSVTHNGTTFLKTGGSSNAYDAMVASESPIHKLSVRPGNTHGHRRLAITTSPDAAGFNENAAGVDFFIGFFPNGKILIEISASFEAYQWIDFRIGQQEHDSHFTVSVGSPTGGSQSVASVARENLDSLYSQVLFYETGSFMNVYPFHNGADVGEIETFNLATRTETYHYQGRFGPTNFPVYYKSSGTNYNYDACLYPGEEVDFVQVRTDTSPTHRKIQFDTGLHNGVRLDPGFRPQYEFGVFPGGRLWMVFRELTYEADDRFDLVVQGGDLVLARNGRNIASFPVSDTPKYAQMWFYEIGSSLEILGGK